jgi:tRNA-binding EMAP/Myf-like protein
VQILTPEDALEVLTIHDDDAVNTLNYKLNKRKIVFGAKQHTVIVPEDVTGIVAYLAAPNGTVIGDEQGMLLQSCDLLIKDKTSNPEICRFDSIYVSLYLYICVLTPLYMCPRNAGEQPRDMQV